MISGRIGWELAMLAVLCVLAIFLFPGVQGPYSVVHGPATALLAARAAARTRIGIVRGALKLLANRLILPLVFLRKVSLSEAVFHTAALPECNAILRC
jgi:hypothetical protein